MGIKRFSLSQFVIGLAAVLIGVFGSQVLAFSVPSEVQNVRVTPDNGMVHLEWDTATDVDGVIIGYKVYYGTSSVQTESQAYDDEVLVPAQTSYTLEGLENGVRYYIVITAVDDEENESETYSVEVSVVPIRGEAPKVISSE